MVIQHQAHWQSETGLWWWNWCQGCSDGKPSTYLFWTWCQQKWRQRRVCSRWMIVSLLDLWLRSPCLRIHVLLSTEHLVQLFIFYHKLMHKTSLCLQGKTMQLRNDTLNLVDIEWQDYMKQILLQVTVLLYLRKVIVHPFAWFIFSISNDCHADILTDDTEPLDRQNTTEHHPLYRLWYRPHCGAYTALHWG